MKKTTTKRALLMSVLSLALCFVMLLGTTYAWFTDSVTSANNVIKSGNLDIELYYKAEGQADWTKVTETTNVFKENTLWEPGHTEVVKLKVVNEGTLALKYQLGVNIASETGSKNVNGAEFKLSNFIKFGIVDGAQTYTRDQAIAAVDATATSLNKAWSSKTITLLPKTDSNTDIEDIVTMVVYMPTTVGNEANPAKGAATPTINLGINLFATQVAAESDSFGDNYDKPAPIVSPAIDRPSSGAVTLNGAENVSVYIPETVVGELETYVTKLSLSVSKPIINNADKTVTFDTVEVVDQNGAMIDLAALATSAKIKITLPVGNAFANGDDVVLYHDGEFVASAKVVDGYITYEAEHFCKVEVVDAESVYDYIVEDLDGFVDALAKGGKVLLNNDIKAEKIIAVEPGADVYLNMNGKTITVNQNTKSNTLLYVKDGAKLVVDGNGTIDLEGVSTMAIFAPYGELVIENGTFIRDKVTTITNATTGLFMGAKTTSSNVVINGGYFDAGYYNEDAAAIEDILAGKAEFVETEADIAKRDNSKDANVVRVAIKDNISALLNHSGYGTFKVYGGTFVGANPAWGDEGCMLPTTPNYLRPWSYYQGALIDGQTFNADGIVLPDGYVITMTTNAAGVPVYTVTYNK